MTQPGLPEQLRRLGIVRGAGQFTPKPRRRPVSVEDLVPGEVVSTPAGSFFLRRQVFEPDYRQGHAALAEPPLVPAAAAALARDGRLAGLEPDRLAFVDVETTSVVGGSGTYCFLVGIGCFEGPAFVLYQFFMRDYDEEPALIAAVGRLFDRLSGVVSFNGRAFDLPLLESRFTLIEQPRYLKDTPHLDLLAPSRRIWKHRLESCALKSLEEHILGVRRRDDEVDGYDIPTMYFDYLRSGDASAMPLVFSHNADDVLSMVVLAGRLSALVAGDEGEVGRLAGEDLYGLAGLLLDLGQVERAEAAYGRAARGCRLPSVGDAARRDLAALLKRQERRAEAVAWWRELAGAGSVEACEELAKHYEWHAVNLAQAAHWTREGLALARAMPRGPRRAELLAAFEHRLERVEGKGG